MEALNHDPRGIVIRDDEYADETLTATGAGTYAAGTLLGRITASGKLLPWETGAGDGSETPIAILMDETVFAGAGDVGIRALINGQVRQGKLVAHNAGTITVKEIDSLRDYGILVKPVRQLDGYDNQ
jgi:hypothetical protein